MAAGLDDLTDYLLAGIALLGVQGSYCGASQILRCSNYTVVTHHVASFLQVLQNPTNFRL
jgi:hypothetical protein